MSSSKGTFSGMTNSRTVGRSCELVVLSLIGLVGTITALAGSSAGGLDVVVGTLCAGDAASEFSDTWSCNEMSSICRRAVLRFQS